MRKKSPTIDLKALAKIGAVPKSVLTVEGQPLVPGLFAQRRSSKLIWSMRYRDKAGSQRGLTLGYESGEGTIGGLASAVGVAAATGREIDFAAELHKSRGAKEAIPTTHIALVASRVRAMLDHGADPVADRQAAQDAAVRAATGYQFKRLADDFLSEGVRKRGQPLRPGTLKEYRRALMVYAAPLHAHSVKEIDQEKIADLIDKVKAGHGAVSASRMRAALSRFFDWLNKKGKAQHNPATHTQGYASQSTRRVLSDDEIRAFWQATADGSAYSTILRVCLLTGCRIGEAAGMHSRELAEEGLWIVPGERTKNHRPLVLPLPRQLRAILPDRDGYLFGRTPARPFSGLSQAKARLDARLKLAEPWTPHALRKTLRTRLSKLKVPPYIAELVINHARDALTDTYDDYDYADEKGAALQRWADELDTIVGNPPPANVVTLDRAS